MTISEWKKIITDKFIANTKVKEAYGLDSNKNFEEQFSKINIESIVFYIVAFVAFTLENLFNIHIIDVRDTIARERRGSDSWYREKALRYQHGRALVFDSDYYDNTGLSEDKINELEVVKQAAAVDQPDNTGNQILRIKIAGGASRLVPLAPAIVQGVQSYFNQTKYAGVSVLVTSGAPDNLFGAIKIHYNPMVLNDQGETVNGEKPVQEAISKYLQNLTFNGEFSIMKLIDAIQSVDGVELAHDVELWAIYANNYRQKITDRYIPDSGYMSVSTFVNAPDTDGYQIQPDKLIILYATYI